MNPALGSFRASGRFIWPLYYFILFVALRSYLASRRKIPADVALGLIAIVQVADLRPLIRTPEGITATEQIQLSSQSEWESLLRDKQSILFYPPYAQTYASHADYRYFWNLARGKSMRLNFGYVSRFNPVTASKADNSMRVEIERGQKQEGALYISSVENAYIFQDETGRWQCRTLDGYLICQ